MRKTPLLAVAMLFLSACGSGDSSASPDASETPSENVPATSPTAPVSASPSEPEPTPVEPGGLAADHIAQVVTEDLVVRSAPEISEDSLIDPLAVPDGFLLFVIQGPVTADGYDWYQVAPFPPDLNDVQPDHPRFGWLAAAGRDGEQWIAPWSGTCPEASVNGIRFVQGPVALACFGSSDLTLEGMVDTCESGGEIGASPAWLYESGCALVPYDYQEGLIGGIYMREETDISAPREQGAAIRVVGHFDDPAADGCIVTNAGSEPTPPELVVLRCRTEFVVTEVTPIAGP